MLKRIGWFLASPNVNKYNINLWVLTIGCWLAVNYSMSVILGIGGSWLVMSLSKLNGTETGQNETHLNVKKWQQIKKYY